MPGDVRNRRSFAAPFFRAMTEDQRKGDHAGQQEGVHDWPFGHDAASQKEKHRPAIQREIQQPAMAFRIQKGKHPVKTRSPWAHGAARTHAPRVPPDDQTQSVIHRVNGMSVRTSAASRGVSRFNANAAAASVPPQPGQIISPAHQSKREEHQSRDKRRQPPGQVPLAAGEIIQSGGNPADEGRLGGDGFAARRVLKSPMSRLDHFQRRESLLGLIVFVQPPREIAQDEQSDDQP